MDIHKAIVQAYKGQAKFPTSLDDESPAGFAEWFTRKPETPKHHSGTSTKTTKYSN